MLRQVTFAIAVGIAAMFSIPSSASAEGYLPDELFVRQLSALLSGAELQVAEGAGGASLIFREIKVGSFGIPGEIAYFGAVYDAAAADEDESAMAVKEVVMQYESREVLQSGNYRLTIWRMESARMSKWTVTIDPDGREVDNPGSTFGITTEVPVTSEEAARISERAQSLLRRAGEKS